MVFLGKAEEAYNASVMMMVVMMMVVMMIEECGFSSLVRVNELKAKIFFSAHSHMSLRMSRVDRFP